MNKKKEKAIYVPVKGDFHARVKFAADLVAESNMSRFSREALTEKMEKVAKRFPQHKEELVPAA